jgi:outer membrane protein TolC
LPASSIASGMPSSRRQIAAIIAIRRRSGAKCGSAHADTTQFPVNVIHNFWRDSLGLTVNWELDFWGKFRRAIESADASYLASVANYDYVLVTLLGNVATTYIGIRTLQTQIKISEENIVKQKKALAIAEAQYHGGTATKLDVYQAENVLGQTEATIPQLTI